MVKDKTGKEIAKVSLAVVELPEVRWTPGDLAFFHSALDGVFFHQGHDQRRHPCEFKPAAAASPHLSCFTGVCLRSFGGF